MEAFDLKEVFFSNLLLLGFDCEAQEAKYRIPFNRDMFLYPNKKAMEIVLHFLFYNLDAPLAFQEFRDCWQVRDKKMEQQFRKSCNSWLTKISKEEPDSNLPRIGPSLFLSPGGDRFYEVLYYFSSYVLRKVMARDYSHGKDRTVPHVCKKIPKMPNMTKIASRAMLAITLSEEKRFYDEVHYNLEAQEHWKYHAMSTTNDHRKLCKEIRECERKLNTMGDKFYMTDKATYVEETETLCRTKQLQEVRSLWSKLETFHESTKEKRAILNEILENSEPKFHLDGASIQLQIPDFLTTKYRHAIQMKNIQNTYEGGKLNMTSLIQLSNLSLHELKEKMRQEVIPNFEPFTPSVKHEVRTHGTYLAQTQNLRTSLQNDFIPELKRSIEPLKEECYSYLDGSVHSPVLSPESFDFGLGLLPTTPSPAFATAGHLVHGGNKIPEISLRKTPRSEATPDVIENLTSSIRELVVRGNRQYDEKVAPSEVFGSRAIHESTTPKPFVSKIPKPMNRRLSRTPDVTSEKTTTVRRRSLTTTKKPKRTRIQVDEVNTEKVADTKKGFASPRVTGLKTVSQRKAFDVHVTSGDEHFKTPLATGKKSAFKHHNSSARNILAEKIAAAVFSEEQSSRAGSSRSSSGENTPKDLALADPLGNLSDAPFTSKDLIPRTPFKREDAIFSDLASSDEDTLISVSSSLEDIPGSSMKSVVGSMTSQPTDHDKTTPPPTAASKCSPTTAAVLQRYRQFKKAQERGTNSKVTVVERPQSKDDTVSGAFLAPEMTSPNTLIGYLRETDVTSASPQSPVMVSGISTPHVNENTELLRHQKPDVSMGTDGIISDVTRSRRQATSVTFSKGFATPMMSSMRNYFHEFGQTPLENIPPPIDFPGRTPLENISPPIDFPSQTSLENSPPPIDFPGQTPLGNISRPMDFGVQTPLEHIAPPIDLNSNSLHQERKESVRSRLSFDFDTPDLSTSYAQHRFLKTPTARDIAQKKMDDVIEHHREHREFNLIPVNTDDLFHDDFRLKDTENAQEETLPVDNSDTQPLDLTPHVEVGQLIELD